MNDTMQSVAQPGANIKIHSVPNLRDMGGWPIRDGGRVRTRLVCRGTALDKLQGDDLTTFANLGIRSIYDLRTEVERSAGSDKEVPGANHLVLDLLKDASDVAPAQLMKVLSDPGAAAALLCRWPGVGSDCARC